MWLFEFVVGEWICVWRHNTNPRLSSITKIFSRRISQSECSIKIKLNYFNIYSLDVKYIHKSFDRMVDVMLSVFTSSSVDRGFEPWSGQTEDYKICCFSARHAALRRKSKDWLARNQDNVSEWDNMSIRWLLLQWASTIKFQLSVLV